MKKIAAYSYSLLINIITFVFAFYFSLKERDLSSLSYKWILLLILVALISIFDKYFYEYYKIWLQIFIKMLFISNIILIVQIVTKFINITTLTYSVFLRYDIVIAIIGLLIFIRIRYIKR